MLLYHLYRFLTFVFSPFIFLYVFHRKHSGKEDFKRFRERFGISDYVRPARGALIWINAASVGESLSVVPLIDRITSEFPEITILITTTTVTSATILKNKLPSTVIHQYMPIDTMVSVKRFLSYWRPNLAIFMESELWPNIIHTTAKTCPMILLNARMSDRTFKKWRLVKPLASYILKKFAIILPQGYVDKERLTKLGAKNLYYIGNLKYASPPLAVDSHSYQELYNQIGERKVLVASSTHKNEESALATIHLNLRKIFPDLLTIIIPRHSTRSIEISAMLDKMGINYSVRSDKGVISEKTDVYLADTMGEIGLFYKLADIVFIGGSLIPQGGHNPIEAGYFNCAIIMGPFTFNFKEIIQEFSKQQAIILTKDEIDLEQNLQSLFANQAKLKEYSAASSKLVSEAHNILELTLEKIMSFIEK